MADPSSTLRQMILFDAEFDVARVRTLCFMITAGKLDQAEAAQLHQAVVDEIGEMQEVLGFAAAIGAAHAGLRDGALAAADRMIKAALG